MAHFKGNMGHDATSDVCPFIEIGYRLIDGKLDSIKPTLLVDFGFVFVARIRARQLVNLGEDSFFMSRLL